MEDTQKDLAHFSEAFENRFRHSELIEMKMVLFGLT